MYCSIPFIETKIIELYLLFYDDIQEIILTTNHELPIAHIKDNQLTFDDMEWTLNYTVSPDLRCVFFGESELQILYTDLKNKLPLPNVIKTIELVNLLNDLLSKLKEYKKNDYDIIEKQMDKLCRENHDKEMQLD